MKFRIVFIIFLIAGAGTVLSCRSRMGRAQKQAYKMEKQVQKENKKMVEEYHKHQYDIQHANTQKMMKRSKKRAKKTNYRRKDSWLNRTFKRKRSKSCDGN